MSKNIYIFSSSPNDYALYQDYDPSVPEKHIVTVKGGAGVTNSLTLRTPLGVVTKVTPEQRDALMRDPTFSKGVKEGFFVVSNAPVGDEDDTNKFAENELNQEHKARQPKIKKKQSKLSDVDEDE